MKKKSLIKLENNSFNLAEVIVLMAITLLLSVFATVAIMSIKDKDSTKLTGPIKEFYETYEEIVNKYYENIDEKELLDSGIEGMIKYLGDPYSEYFSSEETVAFYEEVKGTYTGLGMTIQRNENGTINVIDLAEEGSAYEEGVKINDIIKKVNGDLIEDVTTTQLATMLKGEKDTTVEVTFLRNEKEISFTLKRKEIPIESVTSEMIEKNNQKIGYIQIDIFALNSFNQFKKELNKLEEDKIDSLVIDVRGNSGGYLSVLKEITSMFLNKNDIIYQLDTKGKIEEITDNTKESRTIPVAILIDGASASASEILALAFQESYENAFVLGTKSFGKGTVQQTVDLSNGAMIKYTVQKWLSPTGKSINGTGLIPNYEVKFDYESYELNPSNETDNQLQRAIEILTTGQ